MKRFQIFTILLLMIALASFCTVFQMNWSGKYMKLNKILIIGAVLLSGTLLTVVSCDDDDGITVPNRHLVWEDNFDGNKLDPKKWAVRGVGPRAIGFVSRDAVKVDNGFLELMAYQENDSIKIGAVGTQNLFMIKYWDTNKT